MAIKRKVRKGAARTAKQKTALRKAQLASARKRKRNSGAKTKAKRHYKKNKVLYKAVGATAIYLAADYGVRRVVKRQGRLSEYKSASKIMAANAREKFKEDRSPGRRAVLRTLTSRKSYLKGRKHVGRWF